MNGKNDDERFNERRHLNSGEFSYGENPTISTLNRDAEALGRRISFRVVDVGGAATGGTESGIARANEQIDDEDQKIPG